MLSTYYSLEYHTHDYTLHYYYQLSLRMVVYDGRIDDDGDRTMFDFNHQTPPRQWYKTHEWSRQ
jgi:hypothetical protein